MPRRRNLLVVALLLLQVALLWLTFDFAVLGSAVWHHFASLGVVLGVALALWRPLVRSRRFLALGVLAFSVLATVSGFWLLYWKEGVRIDGYQDWGVFWHVLWSWAAALFFFMHTWINRVALVHFVRKSVSTIAAAVVHAGAYVLVVVAFFITWSGRGRTWFTNENYIQLSLFAWLVAIVVPYGLWGVVQVRVAVTGPSSRIDKVFHPRRVRRWVDLGLVPMATLAVVSGVPLIFLDAWLDQRGFKYVSKYWHVWPSVVFAALVFVHGVQAWSSVRAHWRAYGTEGRRDA
ncbi:MAG: hypothetical protein KY455_13500 [Euryarchaeota archaeon]|nr:hypothetical protein [Euryarchaeota archaeon]